MRDVGYTERTKIKQALIIMGRVSLINLKQKYVAHMAMVMWLNHLLASAETEPT